MASLVYGFLGGVTTTNLVLGSLKVGGSFAVLLGVAYFVNPYLQQEIHPPIYGTYEWQWAGSGWLGTIVVAKDGTAEINMEEFLNCNGQTIKKPLLAMTGKGTANADLSGNTLDVNFPVAFLKYDANCNGTEEPYTSILSGTLDRTSAFAGRIAYINPNSNKNAPSRGDMILTRYISNN